ncbi:hypothetical protein Asal01_00024 [Fodinibius salicampi]|nr:tetratricopeptide repeat protein [Fodinibius salicampi]
MVKYSENISHGYLRSCVICGLILILSVSHLYGQLAPKTDSLKAQLQEAREEQRIEILLKLSDQVRRSDMEAAIDYARKAVDLSERVAGEELRGESHRNLGRLLSMNGKHPVGLQHLSEAKRIFEQIGAQDKIVATLENVGALYRRQGDYSTALEYYYDALDLKEKQNNETDLPHTLINIGYINEKLGQMSKAISFYERALEISQRNDNPNDIAINAVQLSNAYDSIGDNDQALEIMNIALDASKRLPGEHAMASILLEISELYRNEKSYDLAKEANSEALELAQNMSDNRLEALSLKNIATLHAEQNNLEAQTNYLLQAIPLFEKSGMREEVIQSRYQIASNYLISGSITESIEMTKHGLDDAEEIESLELIRKGLEVLTKGYKKIGDLENALLTQDELIEVKDSLFDQTRSRQITEMQTKYETEQKEQEIALLQKEREQQAMLRNAFLIGILLIGIIGILVYNRQRLKIKKKQTELENTRLKEQQLEQDLEFKNKQLTTHSLHLVQKNEAMKELKEKINEMRHKDNGNVNRSLQKLQNLVDYSYSLDEDWEQFRLYFEEVHDHFFDILKKKYPDLTPNELRLSALAKLNLSIKETATIMGITPNSVKTARYRLRKKLDIETEENLTEFMMEIEKKGKKLN